MRWFLVSFATAATAALAADALTASLLLRLSSTGELVWKEQFGASQWDGVRGTHGPAFRTHQSTRNDAILVTMPAPPAQPARAARNSEVRGPYFGQPSPGRTPQKFAPGILSLPNRLEARIAFSPDGNECFFTVPSDLSFSNVQMYHTRCVNGLWSRQTLASFLRSGLNSVQPFFSTDGKRLYFTSARDGQNDIWVVERTATGWGPAQALAAPVNSEAGEGEYSQTAEGDAYFESGRPGTAGGCSLWRARRDSSAEYLGRALGSGTYDADPFVAPDGSYLLFASYRAGGRGKADLYVASPRGDHEWTTPVNLNEYCRGINTAAIEYAPSLSGDGRFLFFVRLDSDSQQCDIWWVENPIPAATDRR